MINGMVFNPSPVFYIIIGVLSGVIVGWVIGFLDSNTRSAKKIEAAEAKGQLALSEAERKIAAAQAQIKSDAPAMIDEPGLLRLKNVNGMPSLEMDGAPLNINAVSGDQKRRLIELLTAIRPWVEAGQPLQPVSKPAASLNSQLQPAPVQPIVSPLKPTPSEPLPSVKPAEEKDIRSLSIVAQIDTVLQKRLADTPLANSGIRLTESSIGGVEVYVGINKYPSIDDVPDAQVKSTIRAAISEWEQKYTPGA